MRELDDKKEFLEFGKRVGVTKACKIYGYSRESYYRLKKLYHIGGEIAIRSKSGQNNKRLGSNAQKIEKIVVNMTIKNPPRGHQWIARKIKNLGYQISSFGVWYIWGKYNLEKRNYRFDAFLARYNQGEIQEEDTEPKIILQLESNINTRSYPTIQSGRVLSPGDLGAIDILTIRENEEGNLYQLTFIDLYSNFAIAKVYDKEIESFNVKYFLQDVVSKILSQYYVKVWRVLTNRSKIYSDSSMKNSLSKYLKDMHIQPWRIDEIDKCTDFHQLVMDDFYIERFRLKSYRGLEKLQNDLHIWLSEYNNSSIQRNYCYGKSPIEILESLKSRLQTSF